MKTAAIIIIGNEILSGKFADENSPFLLKRLRELGVQLRRILVIPDTVAGIADEVRACAAEHDLVFTTGGVGPTHDDLTMAGIARAFDVELVVHPELERVIRDKLGVSTNDAALRMAMVPAGAELWPAGPLHFPHIVMKNVHILPGVPHILKMKFEAVAQRFQGVPLSTARLSTPHDEIFIAGVLEQAVQRFPTVEIGSYPRLKERRVILTIEGADAAQVQACHAWLGEQLAD